MLEQFQKGEQVQYHFWSAFQDEGEQVDHHFKGGLPPELGSDVKMCWFQPNANNFLSSTHVQCESLVARHPEVYHLFVHLKGHK